MVIFDSYYMIIHHLSMIIYHLFNIIYDSFMIIYRYYLCFGGVGLVIERPTTPLRPPVPLTLPLPQCTALASSLRVYV